MADGYTASVPSRPTDQPTLAGRAPVAGKTNTETPVLPQFRTIKEIGGDWLDVPAPPRAMLLTRDNTATLPLGIVGLLVAPGGRGKSMALAQLAVCVATGRPWLGVFNVERPGRVLLILAEEELEEIRRRLFSVTRGLQLSPKEMGLVAERVVPLGLSGQPVALVNDTEGTRPRTPVFTELEAKLREHEYSLVCLDPLSRFAPAAESDNALATAAIQCLESLTQAPGRPTVLVAHHTNKESRREGNRAGYATNIRGVTALTDGVRWQAQLGGKDESDLSICIVKSNYTPAGRARMAQLTREEGGVLRALTPDEVAQRDVVERCRPAVSADKVLDAVRRSPGITSTKLRGAVGGNAKAIDDAVHALVGEGRVVDRGGERAHRYYLPEEVENVEPT